MTARLIDGYLADLLGVASFDRRNLYESND